MHLQILHASAFGIVSVRESNRPPGVCSYRSGAGLAEYENCLVVFTCIEKMDADDNVARAVEEIAQMYDQVRGRKAVATSPCTCVVVLPYSHQRNAETNGKRALGLLRAVFDSLCMRLQGEKVYLGDFGFSNEWTISVKCHRLSCVYRQA